ncbi:MAG TPA: hypothetical protein P5235_11860 [Saprospiraceae bacterium]|nr:hypothetical protein [Saprospiraceae bacterium]MCB9327340.1 hypothetical protein [Lewinellaceae bacterium]HPK09972.1 hypothetical protein [Saprospiraceae bacterium]HRX30076.1 hypothetical protein [Saprospiraceae bacterium]
MKENQVNNGSNLIYAICFFCFLAILEACILGDGNTHQPNHQLESQEISAHIINN